MRIIFLFTILFCSSCSVEYRVHRDFISTQRYFNKLMLDPEQYELMNQFNLDNYGTIYIWE